MNYWNIILGIATLLVIVTAAMKILHLPGSGTADLVGNIAFIFVFFGMALQNSKLKKRIKELEQNQAS